MFVWQYNVFVIFLFFFHLFSLSLTANDIKCFKSSNFQFFSLNKQINNKIRIKINKKKTQTFSQITNLCNFTMNEFLKGDLNS